MLGQLVPTGGGVPVTMLKTRVVIGRDPDCDLVVPSRALSSQHCELTFRSGFWWVKDLDSRNGTGINGKRITERRILPKQVLCIPKMRFRLDYKAPKPERNMSDDSLAMQALNTDDGQDTASTTIAKGTEAPATPESRKVVKRKIARPLKPKKTPAKSTSSPAAKPKTKLVAKPVAKTAVKRFFGKLVPAGGGDPIALLDPKQLIGRSRDSQIRIKQSIVSGRHCMLTWEDGFWFVEDLNSSNGIRVNNEKVDRRILMPGDILSVSSNRFTIEYKSEGEPPRDPGLISKSLLEKAGLQNLMNSEDQPAWITSHESKDEDTTQKYQLNDDDP